MDIVDSAARMQTHALRWRAAGNTVGLVPTMGCLHAGHAALIAEARAACDRLVVSVFVNPLQFAPGEDLSVYPRTPEQDIDCCRACGVDVVFRPAPGDMYAPDASVTIEESQLSRGLCGRSRPGHFSGVLTVVAKLFNIVQPTLAVFGQKDAQQAALVRRMIRDLNMPVTLLVAPTVREPDGLAMSSRNRYLAADERSQARTLNQALMAARALVGDGERRAGPVLERVRAMVATGVPSGTLEYVEIVDAETFEPVSVLTGRVCIAMACRIGRTRLIDNVMVDAAPPGQVAS